MSEPFIGEIKLVGFNFAPRGYATCAGQLLQISQNSALFSLLGTTFGGDGRTTFGLPDLRSRCAIGGGMGAGPGLSNRSWGQKGGSENETLTVNQIPSHTHTPKSNNNVGDESGPAAAFPANAGAAGDIYNTASNSAMGATDPTGGGQSHNNMQPYLAMFYVIATVGIFPSRN